MIRLLQAIRMVGALYVAPHIPARLHRDERGQTAAEYVGVLALVAIIITGIAVSGVGTQVFDALTAALERVFTSGGGGAEE